MPLFSQYRVIDPSDRKISQIISLESETNGTIINNTPEQFMILNLPIPNIKSPSLIDCLNLYVKGEILEGENSWYNEKTQLKQSQINGRIKKKRLILTHKS